MKRTRFKFAYAEKRGGAKTIAADTTLTAANILADGNSFIKINGAYALTLPAASFALKGITLIVASNNGSGSVTVAAGFGGGGSGVDTVAIGAYEAVKVWCDGSYWFAKSENVTS